MIYSHEVEMMCPVAQGVNHGAAPIPEEAKWVKAKEIKDISGLTHGVGWCAPQQMCIRDRSDTLSPFEAELELAEENPITLPPRFSIAASWLKRVRVLGS